MGDFFQGGGGYHFYIKTKLKSERLIDEKSLQAKMFFSVITKNLNWEILTKIFIFKKWERVNDGMKNFNIMGVH